MPLERQQLAIGALIAWLFTILSFMVLSAYLDLELFFALAFIGILIIAELADTLLCHSAGPFFPLHVP